MKKLGSVPANSDYNLNELSRCTGISVGYLSMIFNGKRTNVSLSVLTRLGYTLNLSVAEVRELIQKSTQQAQEKDYTEEAGEEKITLEEQELKELIQRTIQCLEHFDPLGLEDIKQKAGVDTEGQPLRHRLVKWIEGIEAAKNNQFTTALSRLNEARMFRAGKSHEKRMLAKIYGGMGSCYTALGNRKMAFKMFSKSLNIWGKGPDAALVYLNMGTLYRRCHRYSHAHQAYVQAVELGSFFIQIMAFSGLGQVAIDQNDLARARAILLKGYLISKKHPYTWGVPELYCNLGILYKLSHNYRLALLILDKAKLVADNLGAIRAKQFIMIEQGEVLMLLHRVEEANEVFSCLVKEFSEEGDILLAGKTLISLAKLLWEDCPEIALECLQRCYKILGQLEPTVELLNCCQLLVDYFNANPDNANPNLGNYGFYRNEVKRVKLLLKQ